MRLNRAKRGVFLRKSEKNASRCPEKFHQAGPCHVHETPAPTAHTFSPPDGLNEILNSVFQDLAPAMFFQMETPIFNWACGKPLYQYRDKWDPTMRSWLNGKPVGAVSVLPARKNFKTSGEGLCQ